MTTNIPNNWVQDNSQHIILDGILTYLHDLEEPVEMFSIRSGIASIIEERNPLESNVMIGAFNKLSKNGYVDITEKQSAFEDWGIVKYYQITFDGIFHIRSGGYDQRNKNRLYKQSQEDLIKAEHKIHQNQFVFLNRVIATGTTVAAAYYLFEFLKNIGLYAHALTT